MGIIAHLSGLVIPTKPLLVNNRIHTRPVLRFGQDGPDQSIPFDNRVFDDVDAVLKATNYLEDKWISTRKGWSMLPEPIQHLLANFMCPASDRIASTARVLREAIETQKMGILEESADIWHESLSLVAVQEGLIRTEKFGELIQRIQDNLKAKGNLKNAMKIAADMIDTRDAQTLVNLVALPPASDHGPPDPVETDPFLQKTVLDVNKAKDLLALMYLKFATLQLENKAKDPEAYTQTQLIYENRELLKRLPPERADLALRLIRLEPLMTGGRLKDNLHTIRKALVTVIRENIKNQDNTDVLFRFIKLKHTLRQAVRLYKLDDPTMDYEQRKRVYKPFETIMEAYLLRRCINGFEAFG